MFFEQITTNSIGRIKNGFGSPGFTTFSDKIDKWFFRIGYRKVVAFTIGSVLFQLFEEFALWLDQNTFESKVVFKRFRIAVEYTIVCSYFKKSSILNAVIQNILNDEFVFVLL